MTGSVSLGMIFLGLTFVGWAMPASAQSWDFPARWAESASASTGKKLTVSVESRGRYERWRGPFRDLDTGLLRNRLTISYKPVTWLRLVGAVRDSRAPGYGASAPGSVRDQADLHEGYFELFPDQKRGFSFMAGRAALAYGETRLLATPLWGNVPRTFDLARATYKSSRSRVDVLFASPLRVRPDMFNRPVLGERVWGTYSTFSEVGGRHTVDLYALRKQQNRPAGFLAGSSADGTDRLRVDTYGGRATGPLTGSLKYGVEAAAQTGKLGPDPHRAFAFAGWLSRRWNLGAGPFELQAEYKFASGARDPKPNSSAGTFDSLYPSTHDKFGHMDLFGWRNIHYARTLATIGITKSLGLNLMYGSTWLASVRDGVYSASGARLARSITGSAGRHVGQEADIFGTFRFGHFLFGAGGGRFFAGEFVRNTRPAVARTYLYIFHTYAF